MHMDRCLDEVSHIEITDGPTIRADRGQLPRISLHCPPDSRRPFSRATGTINNKER